MSKNSTVLHETKALISLSNLDHNFKYLRSLTGHNTHILFVVKAEAYGHKAELLIPVAEKFADWYGVATVKEAVELRKANAKQPILVFEPVNESTISHYEAHQLAAVVGSFTELEMLPQNISFHLEFDTGMGRLGFYAEDWKSLKSKLIEKKIKPSGYMTHFADADEPNSPKTHHQLGIFHALADEFRSFAPEAILHASNSGGLLNYPDAQFDMVRPGISVYGYHPAGADSPLKPVLSLLSYLVAVKPIKKGMAVSYLSKWKAEKDGYVGVIPVGYADGIPRSLSNKIQVYTAGKMLNQVGVITMDYMMVFSEEPLTVGSEVELLGPNSMLADSWAKIAGTIPYEILTGIHPKIKRESIELNNKY